MVSPISISTMSIHMQAHQGRPFRPSSNLSNSMKLTRLMSSGTDLPRPGKACGTMSVIALRLSWFSAHS